METIVHIHSESEYNEILQQAVAVIETARGNAARAIVSTSNEMYWRIGQLLYERKLGSKHGDKVVKRLSADLKSSYPKMGMSVRRLDMRRAVRPVIVGHTRHFALMSMAVCTAADPTPCEMD